MSNPTLPGNPYQAYADMTDGGNAEQIVTALQALAFEQRTANLVAILPLTESTENAWVRQQITARLGLDGAQT